MNWKKLIPFAFLLLLVDLFVSYYFIIQKPISSPAGILAPKPTVSQKLSEKEPLISSENKSDFKKITLGDFQEIVCSYISTSRFESPVKIIVTEKKGTQPKENVYPNTYEISLSNSQNLFNKGENTLKNTFILPPSFPNGDYSGYLEYSYNNKNLMSCTFDFKIVDNKEHLLTKLKLPDSTSTFPVINDRENVLTYILQSSERINNLKPKVVLHSLDDSKITFTQEFDPISLVTEMIKSYEVELKIPEKEGLYTLNFTLLNANNATISLAPQELVFVGTQPVILKYESLTKNQQSFLNIYYQSLPSNLRFYVLVYLIKDMMGNVCTSDAVEISNVSPMQIYYTNPVNCLEPKSLTLAIKVKNYTDKYLSIYNQNF